MKGGNLARKGTHMYGKWEFSVGQDFRIAVYMSPFRLHIKLHVKDCQESQKCNSVSALPGGTVEFSPQSN